jgi:hypothetical protein
VILSCRVGKTTLPNEKKLGKWTSPSSGRAFDSTHTSKEVEAIERILGCDQLIIQSGRKHGVPNAFTYIPLYSHAYLKELARLNDTGDPYAQDPFCS